MAYLAPIETTGTQEVSLPAIATGDAAAADFSELEWSIVRLSRIDRLWTIRPAGPARRFWKWVVGRANPQLANERLEALRRMAVMSWHYGFNVHSDDIAAFLAAGFSLQQYELLVSSISKALRPRPSRAAATTSTRASARAMA